MDNYPLLLRIVGVWLALLLFACQSSPEPAFHSDWSQQPDRIWAGPQYWANRLQDWQVRGGRLECVENSEARPMRVIHLLTGALENQGTELQMRVETGPIDAGALGEESWTGFLVGAGSEQIDYRLTALTHHRAAEDGGMFVGVDGTGRVVFRDFTQGGGGDTWSVTGKTQPGELAEIEAAARSGEGLQDQPFQALRLELSARPTGETFSLTLTAKDESGALLSTASLDGVQTDLLNGSVALVSHRGPAGSDKGF